jgi:hypothetical protein
MTAKTFSRDQIRAAVLGAQDRAFELVEVPEWGVSLRVMALSGIQRDRYQNSTLVYGTNDQGMPAVTGYNPVNSTARLVSMSVVDDDGKPIFSEADVLDLGDRNATVLERVAAVARQLSGLTADAVEAAKARLKADLSASSSSDSPATSGS